MSKIIPLTKICTKCKVEKIISLFYKDKNKKYGYQPHCKECDKLKGKAYYSCNKDSITNRCKAYREKNKEQQREQSKKYYYENKDKIIERHKQYNKKESVKEYYKKYRALNKEKISEYGIMYMNIEKGKLVSINSRHKRRSKEKQGDVDTKQLLKLQQNAKVCYWCNESLKNKKLHIDHYFPLSKGGEHTLSNLVVSCDKCNLTKNAKDPIEFANSIGKLL